MGVIRKKIIEVIQQKYKGDFSLEDLVNFCFDAGIIEIRRCEIAVIKKHYAELLRDNPTMKASEAKTMTAENFHCSESKIEQCLYYYKNISL